jgi:superfamily II helicase
VRALLKNIWTFATMNRIEREKRTVEKMIGFYCRDHHHPEEALCDECSALQQYALTRVDKCIFGKNKPVCAECTVHCYKKDMRERVRQVMRYAGPRMLFHYPYLAFMHMFDKKFTPQ